jgi:thioredoxin-like negative regulator of GroEL
MRKRNLAAVTALPLLLAGAMLASGSAEEPAGDINWIEAFAPALERAEADGKPVLVDVWAIWCVPCKEMDETTYRDARVIEEAAAFVPLKIDADVATSFVERYRVDAFPTLLFLDGRGREIARWRGAITAEPLTELLEKVGDGYAAYLEGREQADDPEAALAVAGYLETAGNAPGAVVHLQKSLKALKRAEPSVREPLELRLGDAQVAAGEPKAACKSYQRLADEAALPEIRGKALVGLVRAERERGHEAQAAAALERLRAEFPDLAAEAAL